MSSIEVSTVKNNIDIKSSVNKIVTSIEKNIIELSTSNVSIDVQPIINLLKVIDSNTSLVVASPKYVIEVINQAANLLQVTNVSNKIEVVRSLNTIALTTQQLVIEVNTTYKHT